MSVRTRYSLSAAVSSTTAEEKDLGNVKWEVVTDLETKGGAWKTVLAVGATDIQLQIDNITTIKALIIRTNAQDPNQVPNGVSIKRNSNVAESILIQPLGDAKEGHLFITTDSLTAVYATNEGSAIMEMTVVAVGV